MKNKFFANFVSYLFVPPVMTLAVFVLIAQYEPEHAFIVVANSLVFGVLLPIAVFVFMRKKKMIANDDATIKEERTLPYLIGAGLTLAALTLNYVYLGSSLSTFVWIVYFISSLAITGINKFWKISAHTMGVGIPLGITLATGNEWEYVFVLILALVMWARLYLRVHTPAQVLAGALLGSTLSVIILSLR